MTQQPGYRNSVLQDEVNEWVRFFRQPPDGFNPITASREELEGYGIPPKPDSDQQPALTRFWNEMYAPPLVFVRPSAFNELVIPSPRDSLLRTRREASRDWSGA